MPTPKSERLLNLLILLLVQRRPVSKDRIRSLLYPDSSPEGFEKMFERDKDELRSLGVPIEVAATDPLFDDEVGYRIPPDEFALPDIELSAEEAAVVGLAARVWQHASMAEATSDAVRKLAALGADVDLAALDLITPAIDAEDPAFEVCWRAACERRRLEFPYRRPGRDEVLVRHLEPWGVVRSAGRWYVVGHDTDRGAERMFRLSRIEGEVRALGPAGAFTVPAGTDVRAIAHRLGPPPATEQAVLLLRPGAAPGLRRAADATVHGVSGPDGRPDWDRIEVRRSTATLVEEVLALGTGAVLLEPVSARRQVVERLRAVLA